MNCLEFRRLKLAEPHIVNKTTGEHIDECVQCAEFSRQVEAMENNIAVQLNAVQVPAGLADKILLGHQLHKPSRPLWAYAAVMLLAIGVFISYQYTIRQNGLADIVIAHVLDEPQSLTTNEHVSSADFARLLVKHGGNLNGPIGQVRYVRDCPMPGGVGQHFVVETPYGLATIILLPTSIAPQSPLNITKQGLSIALLPVGSRNMGIIVDSSVNLEKTVQLMQQQISWQG